MSDHGVTKVLYAALAVAATLLAYNILRPSAIRHEGPAQVAPVVDAGTGPAIPKDVLGVPPGLMPMGGADAAHGHWFIPYAVLDEDQGIAMVQALRAELLRGKGFPEQLAVPTGRGAAGGEALYRAEPGVARFYISDINNPEAHQAAEAKMPLVITQPHPGDDAVDVLFVDGHLASVPVGRFPLSPGFLAALSELDPPASVDGGH